MMRHALVVCVIGAMVFVASPAFAEDGRVPSSKLASLGLGNMKVASDEDGMKVRGSAAFATTSGFSLAFSTLPLFLGFGADADAAANPFGAASAAQGNATAVGIFPFAFSSAGGGGFAFAQ